MDKSFFILMDDVKRRVEKSNLKNKDGYIDEIERIKVIYKDIEVKENRRATYDSVIKIGKELLNEEKDFKKKLEVFLRYCNAAVYDFTDGLKPLKYFMLMYTISCMLFMILAPQYLSALLPLLMILPIFLGLRGMRKRSLNGLILGLSVMPMSLLTSTIVLKNAYLVRNNPTEFFMSLAQQYNRSIEFVRTIFIGSTVLGFIMLVTTIYTIYMGYKYRKMFV
ncbi:hypothetical protein ABG79_01497 [Caloramator mitchellensis]|uniref:Alpha-glucosidase n=1 Tax=Caloramator mitchellensis TaxID=908809 RepID=A0A0R3JTB3_CALMK|nr:hypothetical protein [Caloramator mitchellensis]KRQ86745.1 hypothetical protein ABG79_01497 [Caloramator mitchellensis]